MFPSHDRQPLREGDYPLLLRVDDDVILEPDYIEKLIKVIEAGYDLATGVTPFMGQTQFKRESRFIQPIGNRVILNNEGNFLFNGDDFGIEYYDEAIIPIHHFRSCALIKKEVFDKIDYNSRLTKHGFREEQILSLKMIINGFKLAVNTKAIAWHLLTPSGGERFADSNEMIKINEEVLKEFTKQLYHEHGDFIKKYNENLGININSFGASSIGFPTSINPGHIVLKVIFSNFPEQHFIYAICAAFAAVKNLKK